MEQDNHEVKKQGCELLCSHAENMLPIPGIPYWCLQRLLRKLGEAVEMDESLPPEANKNTAFKFQALLYCELLLGP